MAEGRVVVLGPDGEREEPFGRGQVEGAPEVPIQRRQHHRGDAEREGQGEHRGQRERAAAGQRSQRAAEIAGTGTHRSCRSRQKTATTALGP